MSLKVTKSHGFNHSLESTVFQNSQGKGGGGGGGKFKGFNLLKVKDYF